MKFVYICSPYAGEVKKNVEKAKRYCRFAVKEGYMPMATHLLYTQFIDDTVPEERAIGMNFGENILNDFTEEVWVFGEHISSGMHSEIELAKSRSIPIRFFSEDCELKDILL